MERVRNFSAGMILAALTAAALWLAGMAVRGTDGSGNGRLDARLTEAGTASGSRETVLVGGMPIGIYMETDGVMVLSTERMEAVDGKIYEPAARLIRSGDYITAVDHREISGKADLLDAVETMDGEDVVLTVRRSGELLDVRIRPVECTPDEYRLGIWVRDNVQGLGTVTFLTASSRFGALGHGIHDADTNVLMAISDGSVYRTSIRDIRKGSDGSPGSMEGIIVYNRYNVLGSIDRNTEAGIYGTIDRIGELFEEQIPVETAKKEEITTGSAQIRCCVDGEVKEYEIQVTEVDRDSPEINKGLVIQVTDPELLEKTGGIIQGMSGSPILKDGKLIGAVTHVFVQDSTMVYGIFIENMLDEVESSETSKTVSN